MKSVAYLGPAGTFSDLALKCYVRSESSLPCISIEEVFSHVSDGSVEFGFVPIENLIEGPVTETLDLLRKYNGKVFIAEAYLFDICHAVGMFDDHSLMPNGLFAPELVTDIYSHQQALGQCSTYLRRKFPNARFCAVGSSAEAINMVRDRRFSTAVVVAAAETLRANGFKVIAEDIADVSQNKTRFVLLARGEVCDVNELSPIATDGAANRFAISKSYVTSIVIDPGKDRQGLLVEILNVISVQNGVNIISIHSRPDLRGGFLFYMDLEGSLNDAVIRNCLVCLGEYCREATLGTVEFRVFGSYKSKAFEPPPFSTIGIIGGEGKMGRWFSKFFSKVGFEVIIYDLKTSVSLEELMRRAEVVIVSVPMSELGIVIESIAPLVRTDHLLVENFSIKNKSLLAIDGAVADDCEVLGIHTLFGPDVETISGQNVIITKTSKSGSKAAYFEDLLYKYGARITHASSVEHDSIVAVTSGLLHFVSVCYAQVVRECLGSKYNLDLFSTPNFRAVFEIIQRVVNQTPQLLSDIQMLNDEMLVTRRRFLQALFNHLSVIENGNDREFLESARLSKDMLS
ncbi:MAG: prephenate dehydrogenase/arogenate dehydrogenase family protein [Deltaproteobacteria bacterium]|nr:prephenate dehydrogenase/arogenate dehydrogenase family protein [Deltaproteobacteria bacterium]